MTSYVLAHLCTWLAGGYTITCVAFSLKLLHCRDRALPPLDNNTYGQPSFLEITRMCIVYTQVFSKVRDADAMLHAISCPCILAL